MRLISLACFALLFFLTACYENEVGCLEPDATNYALLADEGCSDCCTFPDLSVRISTLWGEEPFAPATRYVDAAGDSFRIVRFRYYLGDLRLISNGEVLPEPDEPVAVNIATGGDTLPTTVTGNLLLRTAGAGAVTSQIGSLRIGSRTITGLSGTYGLPQSYSEVIPSSAPSGSPLATQPGLLNYRDGRGYALARLEYVLAGSPDTLSATSFGNLPFSFDFGDGFEPVRGFSLTLEIEANLEDVLGAIDISADTAAVVTQLTDRLPELLTVVGASQ